VLSERRLKLAKRVRYADNWIMNGEGVQSEYVSLYHRAFAEYRAHALWNIRRFEQPTPEDALVVARALRTEGDLGARRLAEQIEQACHAAV
jgi:hypothetical protein